MLTSAAGTGEAGNVDYDCDCDDRVSTAGGLTSRVRSALRVLGPRARRAAALPVLAALLAAACVGAKPKPAEPGLGPAPVPAGTPSPGPAADSLRVYLMSFGPGGEVWEHFGHTAIWVHDPARGTDQAYNYGMFDFQQSHFFRRFIQGKMLYWMAGFDARAFADWYIQHNRSVWVQELALTPAQREALRQFLVWNERPENRFYPYDYYRDGCATRVRDALDRVLGGQIYAQTRAVPSGTTYRSHSLKLVEDSPFAYTGLALGLGRPTDRPISLWEEMFLPLALRDIVRRVTVTGPDGRVRPLVASERTVYESTLPPEPAEPPERTWMYLALGLVIAALLAGSAELVRRGRVGAARGARTPPAALIGRTLLALTGGAWSLVSGAFGLLLIFLWALTAHVTSQNNENVLQTSALALPLVVLLPAFLLGARWALRQRLASRAFLSFCRISCTRVRNPLFGGLESCKFSSAPCSLQLARRHSWLFSMNSSRLIPRYF